ncbi:MAG: hypothetical protein K2N85_06940, partial [Lachnospiraceae bacterium]|nr:hypothetical protein [Lachnospiraceae bacterium]
FATPSITGGNESFKRHTFIKIFPSIKRSPPTTPVNPSKSFKIPMSSTIESSLRDYSIVMNSE